MGTRLNEKTYTKLIEENIAELEKYMPEHSLEKKHTIDVLRWSIKANYHEPPPIPYQEEAVPTAEEFFRKKLKETRKEDGEFVLIFTTITAEQGLRWAHEFKELHVASKEQEMKDLIAEFERKQSIYIKASEHFAKIMELEKEVQELKSQVIQLEGALDKSKL